MLAENLKARMQQILALADVKINGGRPWDIAVHDERFYPKLLRQGSLGLGESYMDAWWDCPAPDQMVCRIVRAGLEQKAPFNWKLVFPYLRARLFNAQSRSRASQNAGRHYDLGNELFRSMLDPRMVYSCANWECASSLEEAQEAKLHFVCRKLNVRRGAKILDIGCGWGSFAKFAAEKYGAEVVGITLSREQVRLGREICAGLPIEIRYRDYRDVNGSFDHIVSLGAFEHVGYKNYRAFMEVVHRCLKKGGLFFLGTIGTSQAVQCTDAWTEKYIFPGGMLPSVAQIGASIEGLFIPEEWQDWGAYYDKTLMAWFQNFQENWDKIRSRYSERFYRMWKYYLLSAAGSFRARRNQVWQILFSPLGAQ